MATGCDQNCHRKNLCRVATSSYEDDSKCKELLALWDSVS